MSLLEYKNKNNLTYEEISCGTGIPRSIVHRICTDSKCCVKLRHAHSIVKWSKGMIQYENLMEDCG
jgi:hypothetical protein